MDGGRGGDDRNGVEMPGRLIMDQQGALGSQDLKKDRSQAQEGTLNSQSPPAQIQSMARTNAPGDHGPNGLLPNGVPAAEQAPPTTNGESSMTSLAVVRPENPPPLDQSWRQHDSNKRLGVLMERLAQKCYWDLNVTLTQMSQISVQPQQNQPNGIVPHTGEDISSGSLQKKRLLMEFAKEQRDRFIKTLVLTEWCKNEEDQGKLIDVKVWQDKQRAAQASASQAINQTKANMIPAKVPNPNIGGAMELLATSKASWIPDLGYILPKRLTAKQLLKTLRDMNVTLATRLNLHEDLPPHFQDFSLADGRATFVVKDEFEVDLSVADEDPATPFYFIDIRLLFTPASNVLDDRLRGFMEAKVNQELSTKGLKGCYDFLHNFVITHKINVLRSQAMEMIRGKWFDCIRPESMRRNFVVQYWAGMPGPKSWIEIGISSGKERVARSRSAATPQISVRWFRRGVEVNDEALEFDWRHLDLEKCISIVISKHTEWILKDLETRIRGLAGESPHTTVEIANLDPVSDTPTLSLNQASLREPLQVRVEPVTGQFSISPPAPSTAHAERRLNNDPSADASKWLAWLVCVVAQERIRKESELLAWVPTPNVARQDNLERLFGEAVRHVSIYSPSQAWGDRWALAVTFSLSGDKWWAVSLDEKRGEQANVADKVIASARRVAELDATMDKKLVSRSSLMHIERLAVAEVAFSALSKQLKDMHIPHTSEKLVKGTQDDQVGNNNALSAMAMFIRFSALMKPQHDEVWKPWATEMIRLTHHGVLSNSNAAGDDPGSIRHDLRLTLEPGKMGSLQKHLTQSQDRNLAMSSSGGLALRFVTLFGQPFAEQIQQRLQAVERLDRYVATLEERHYKCTRVSLSRLEFTYNESPQLGAQLNFSKDGGLPVRLKLQPPDSNPHQRIRVILEQGLNGKADTGFESFTSALKFTLPVMQNLDQQERVNPAKQTLVIHPRTSTCFSLKYRSPLPDCEFQLRAKKKVEGETTLMRWHIEQAHNSANKAEEGHESANNAGLPEPLVKLLQKLWQSKGEHWEGIGNGIVADAQGIGDALKQVDDVVRRFETSEEAALKPKEGAQQPASEHSKSQAQSQSQPQGQSQASAASSTTAPVSSDPDVIMID